MTPAGVRVQEERAEAVAGVAESMSQLLRQVLAVVADLSTAARDAAIAVLASNMQAMDLALGDADILRGLSSDLATTLARGTSSGAYLRAAAELTCMQERAVDMQVRAPP